MKSFNTAGKNILRCPVENKFVLGHHQHAVLPAGDFEFQVLGERKAKVLHVWNISALMGDEPDLVKYGHESNITH